jgi:hypothetical protein
MRFAVGGEYRFLRDPVNLESRRIKARGNVATNRRFALEDRLPRKNKNGVLSPIRNYLLNILPGGSEICPLRVPAQQFLTFGFRIEPSLSATIQSQCEKNQE